MHSFLNITIDLRKSSKKHFKDKLYVTHIYIWFVFFFKLSVINYGDSTQGKNKTDLTAPFQGLLSKLVLRL